MSEDLVYLEDIARDRGYSAGSTPETSGPYAAEMLRRCRLRDVPVYLDLRGSQVEVTLLKPDTEYIVYYLHEGKPNPEWRKMRLPEPFSTRSKKIPQPHTRRWKKLGLPNDPSTAFVYVEVPEAGEVEWTGPDSTWPKPSKPCLVDPNSIQQLSAFFQRKEAFRPLSEFEDSVRIIDLFGGVPLPMKVKPDANSRLLLQVDGLWQLREDAWHLHRCFEILQNEKMVKKLDEQSPQHWQWLVGIDYAKVFVDLVYKHGLCDSKADMLRTFQRKDGTSFDHEKTTWNSNSAAPRKLMELLGIVLSEFKKLKSP